jgi:CHAT domain-containing protein
MPGFAGSNTSIRTAVSAYTVTVGLKELQRQVERFRAEVTSPARRGVRTVAARALFATLFPTEEARATVLGAARLVISPDGPLWEAPFAALVTDTGVRPRYLGATRPITLTQSLTLFAQSRTDAPKLASGGHAVAVAVGNPVFDHPPKATAPPGSKPSPPERSVEARNPHPASRIPSRITSERSYLFVDGSPPQPLPESRREALEVAKLYGGDALTEERATEAELRARVEQADVIHLATHGYLNPLRAMSSGLLLTAPKKQTGIDETANDGAFQAWEIYSQLKLKAELVVLSACETGRGQTVRSEGVVGLTRALQYAGARSVVASQWKVQDRSTSVLMRVFHKGLRRGLAKDEALRQAMDAVRKRRTTAHPYHWAGFILIGDPDNPNLAVASGQ